MKIIARIQSDFETNFGIPRQSGLVQELKSTVVFEPEFRNPDTLIGLDEYTYIWLIWEFSQSPKGEWSPKVRPPALGGNVEKGVFASRAPFRPNPIGLSCVKLEKIEAHPSLGNILHIAGADLMTGTPIYDIKPYLVDTECHPDARRGFVNQPAGRDLEVVYAKEILDVFPEKKRIALINALSEDPRPSYQKEEGRVYGVAFAGYDVRFTVEEKVLMIKEVVPRD